MDNNQQADKMRHYEILARLDESLPLATEQWTRLDNMLVMLAEFAPESMLAELRDRIISFADDQAQKGYLLGQIDLLKDVLPPKELRPVA